MLGSIVTPPHSPLRALPRITLALSITAVLLGASTSADAASIRKGPYLQALGQAAVTIKLELSTPEPATVLVTGPAGFTTSKASASEKRFHAIRVEGLSPATTYAYRVKIGDVESKPVDFTTAPADDRPFKFVAYGDSRSDAAAHAAVARAIEAAPGDFFVHTGDMVQDGNNEAQWQEFFGIEGKLLANRCIFVAVGNHELTAPDPTGQVNFLRYFAATETDGRERPHLYGSFRWSNTRFFLLNAMDTWTGDEKEWLRAELASALDEPGLVHRIAVLHHGPFSSGYHGGNARLASQGIIPMLRDNKVELVIAGHDHVYERGEGQGLKYIVSGGAGAPLYQQRSRAPGMQYFESVHHFLEFAVDGPEVQVLARRASGSVIEQCSYRGTESWSCKSDEKKPATAATPATTQASTACACAVPGSTTGNAGGAAALVALAALGALGARRRVSSAGDT
ncbi:metallophosphoesterase [Polyangium jinanense]|uniref:Metallophosphoesterase n=1 Tax=Polyangium jinanense TaxID=2829994 RepID=A0A9X3WZR3_9BACT|nr:metallophosphoesterase [Polyangium jinanense]MDC3981104.1 metallophosphoesterase [Polyangium jinanense]